MQAQSTRRRKRDGEGLGRTQKLVLHLLADTDKSVRTLALDWPGLTRSSVGGAIDRLALRGLVDLGPGEWTGGHFARTYILTADGREVERSLVGLDEEDES